MQLLLEGGALAPPSSMTATNDDLLSELENISSLLTTLINRITTYRGSKAVTPQDGVDLPDGPCIGVILSEAGTVSYIAANEHGTKGDFRSAVALPAGYNPIPMYQIWATGTTPTTIEAIY